jgi:hypothetical protein
LCLHLNESSEGAKRIILGTLDWRGLFDKLQLALGLFHLELSASMLVAGLVGCWEEDWIFEAEWTLWYERCEVVFSQTCFLLLVELLKRLRRL